MGIETAIVAAVAASVVGAAYSTVQQGRAQKDAAKAQREASDINQAQQKTQEMEARRQQIRQQRIRAAQVEQAAANTGTSASSGELGSLSALSTNVGSNLANMSGQALAAQGIGATNQSVADAMASSQRWGMIGQISSGVGSLAGSASSLISTASVTQPAPISQSVGTPTGHN